VFTMALWHLTVSPEVWVAGEPFDRPMSVLQILTSRRLPDVIDDSCFAPS
jgi:hypothetical protein